MAPSDWETVKGDAVNVGDELMFHRLKVVIDIWEEISPFNEKDITRFAVIKTPHLQDSSVIRLSPKQSYRRFKS